MRVTRNFVPQATKILILFFVLGRFFFFARFPSIYLLRDSFS